MLGLHKNNTDPMYKSRSLNLFSPDGTTKFDIDVLDDKVAVNCERKIVIHPTLDLGAEHADVGATLTSIKADIINNFAESKTASNLVQSNLDSFSDATDASIGSLQAGLASETAQRTAALASEAQQRADAVVILDTKIGQESAERKADVASLLSDLAQESAARTAAVDSETALRAAAVATLQSKIDAEKARIDSILSGSEVDLDSLKEVVAAFASSGSNTLQIITGIQSQVTALQSTLATLTEGSTPSAHIIEAIVSGLVFASDAAWMTGPFSITYDLTDRYDFASSSYVGWAQVKAETIAVSGGVLSATSTDEEVKAFLDVALQAQYGAKYSGSPEAAALIYDDYDHYILSKNLAAGSKPYFQGSPVTGATDVTWRLDYCTTAGDPTTVYSTIMSGKQVAKNLVLAPDSIETPVNGLSGVRVGYKSTTDSLTVQ